MVSERNGVDSKEVPTEPMCAGPPANSLMGVIYKGSFRCCFQLPPALVRVEVRGAVRYCQDLPHFTQKLQVWGPQLDPRPAGCPSGGFSQFPSGLTILQNNSQSSGKSCAYNHGFIKAKGSKSGPAKGRESQGRIWEGSRREGFVTFRVEIPSGHHVWLHAWCLHSGRSPSRVSTGVLLRSRGQSNHCPLVWTLCPASTNYSNSWRAKAEVSSGEEGLPSGPQYWFWVSSWMVWLTEPGLLPASTIT